MEENDLLIDLDKATSKLAATVDRSGAAALIGMYYDYQVHRMALGNQVRTLTANGQSGGADIARHFQGQMAVLEKQAGKALAVWAKSTAPSRWAMEQKGIGPILAAGVAAFVDITKAPTAGHIWRYAGLDPTVTWGKGEKRPWNASFKVHCWRIGDSFVKVSGKEDAFYGQVYRERKALEVARNEAGMFADQAARSLSEKNIKDSDLKATYEAGRLPAGRLDLRARRYAVKLFLAHFHQVAYEDHYGHPVPLPYPIAHLGHAHVINPPGYQPAE